MKVLIAAILALFMAGSAGAENYNLNIPANTGEGGVHDFFPSLADAWTQGVIYTTTEGDSADVSFNPAGIPGWLHVTIPEEATLTRGRIVFKEADDLAAPWSTQTYTWGDTVNFYIGETLFDEWFRVSGWDEVEIRLVGSAPGFVDVYCWAELYTD